MSAVLLKRLALRDDLAKILHELLCDGRHDDTLRPCWTAWRIEADSLMPTIEAHLNDGAA